MGFHRPQTSKGFLMSKAQEIYRNDFAAAVKNGLQGKDKYIPSKYLYDQKGSELFVEITKLDEYYLTGCELEIFKTQSHDIVEAIGTKIENLIELGCGDGHKTKVLLHEILEKNECKFTPVDISKKALNLFSDSMANSFPDLKITPFHGDYFEFLEQDFPETDKARLILFLGSNIGNFAEADAVQFLSRMSKKLRANDYLLLGADLKKDIDLIHAAYNDKKGVTSEFNFNLLDRMNRELGADFDRENFHHHGIYNAHIGAMESFLVAKTAHEVRIDELSMTVDFDILEPIHIENSYKYSYKNLKHLADESGFGIVKNFTDSREYFVSSLWKKK